MPRSICGDTSEFFQWLGVFADPDHYVIVHTYDNELIADPRKTTKPLRYAYFKTSEKNAESCVKELIKRGFIVLKQKRYEWDTEKPVGVRVIIEED